MISPYLDQGCRTGSGGITGKTRRAGAPKNRARGKWRSLYSAERALSSAAGTRPALSWGVSTLSETAVNRNGTKGVRAICFTRAQRSLRPVTVWVAALTLTAARVRVRSLFFTK